MAGSTSTEPAKRVVKWDGFKPADLEVSRSHTITKADWKKTLGPDTKMGDVVFHRDNGFFVEIPADQTEALAYFEATPGFTVKPA